jgi:ADP-ribosylglycohydrolase
MYYADFQTLIAKTIQFSKVTHADPRCTACSVAFTLAMAMLMRNGGKMSPEITNDALKYAKVVLKEELDAARDKGLLAASDETNMDALYKQYCEELDQSAQSSLTNLQLGTKPIGTVFKCMGSGFWALREAASLQQETPPLAPQEIYRQVMTQLIGEGGDADTNGAVAGSMLGVFLGVEAIPQKWKTELETRDQQLLEGIIPTFQGIASQTTPAVPKG